jgi:hypothetical protein
MLLAPTVIPPITPWSRSIRIKGQHTGAVVSIFADGQRIGGALASGPDMFVPLDPGFAITPGQKIGAAQELGGVKSLGTAKTADVTVLNAPTPAMLGKIFSRAPLSACATCLWLEGIVPGADVTVIVGGGTPITVAAEWTAVHVDVPTLAPGEVVVVRQGRGAVIGPNVSLPPALPQPDGLTVPPPRITEPLYECERALELFDVRPGSRITVDHDGDVTTFCFGATRGTLWLARRLELEQRVVTRQDFPGCEMRSGDDGRYEVSAAGAPPPWFLYPVCAGDRDVDVGGLRPGASIQFLIGEGTGKVVSGEVGEPPHRFNLPPLGNVKRLGVRQALCPAGPWSETTWTHLVQVGSLDEPRIEEPLHDCGSAVSIAGLTAGTRVYVISQLWGDSIGTIVSVGDVFTDVVLDFELVLGDTLSLALVRCGQPRVVAGGVSVKPAPGELMPPSLDEPLDDTGATITVRQLVPGAFCDVERLDTPGQIQGVLLVSQPVARAESSVGVPQLPPGTLVRCRQRLCGRISRPSTVVKIGDRPLEYEPGSADRLVALTGIRGHGMRPPRYDTTSVGLIGTDLGIPVVHGGKLYLLLGDCDGDEDNDDVMDADADPIAWTTDPPDWPGGPYLNFLTGSGGKFHRLHADGLAPLGNFEVPTGAFSYHGRLYVFIAREKVPSSGPGERMNTSHLAVTKQPGGPNETLELLYDVASTLPKSPPPPAGRWLVHVSPTVVRCQDWPGLPQASGDGVLLFGSEAYHASNLFLAFCPLVYTSVSMPLGPGGPMTLVPPPIPHPSTWRYFVQGQPATPDHPANWRPASALPPTGPTPLFAGTPNLGEVSVGWYPSLRRWLSTSLGGGGVEIRSAREPWGPWSAPALIFDGMNPLNQATADNLQPGHQFVGLDHDWENRKTGVYAPYLVPIWSRFDRSVRRATIHYTLSTEHPPYNVQLMKARLQYR